MIAALIATCFLCCGFSLWLTHKKQAPMAGVMKIMGSLCFVVLAVALNLHAAHLWFFIGLLLCLTGDAWLTSTGSKGRPFILGLLSFLAAHFCYLVAFVRLGIDLLLLPWFAALVAIVLLALTKWLLPGLSRTHKKLVLSYLLVIGLMVIMACSIDANVISKLWIGAGATTFALSDIFVANHRFKNEAFINRLLGLPLYCLAQILLIQGFDKVL